MAEQAVNLEQLDHDECVPTITTHLSVAADGIDFC